MTWEETISRLQAWAARAQQEAQEADTQADILNWQAQAQALSSIATFLADQAARADELSIWTRIVADREEAMAAWFASNSGASVAYYAGAVAGYDVALTAVKDVAGRVWPRIEPHVA